MGKRRVTRGGLCVSRERNTNQIRVTCESDSWMSALFEQYRFAQEHPESDDREMLQLSE